MLLINCEPFLAVPGFDGLVHSGDQNQSVGFPHFDSIRFFSVWLRRDLFTQCQADKPES